MTEIWRDIPSLQGCYQASSEGRIRRSDSGRILSDYPAKSGYLTVSVCTMGCQGKRLVSRLVCEAFHGEPPTDKHHAAHGDHDFLNNRESNLRWATKQENEDDKTASGRRPAGEAVANAKLTEADVRHIRSSYVKGSRTLGSHALARRFGVSQPLISMVVSGQSWSHVSTTDAHP